MKKTEYAFYGIIVLGLIVAFAWVALGSMIGYM